MTDEQVCSGYVKGRQDLELSADTLYIKVKGGLEAITLRFDSDAASPQRIATDLERRVGAFAIQAPEYSRALDASRLRYRALTLVRSLEDGDIDIRGIGAARNAILNCSEFNRDTPTSKCDDGMRAAMIEKGLSAADVEVVCGR